MEELIKALQRFDSLETVISELKAYDRGEDSIEDLTEYLNDEADYANEQKLAFSEVQERHMELEIKYGVF